MRHYYYVEPFARSFRERPKCQEEVIRELQNEEVKEDKDWKGRV
jgi:hypothetical protein